MGRCDSLELVVYEIRHSSVNDARVGLTKEAFRMLADEFCERALVFFVPQDDKSNYRFSLIEITLNYEEGLSRVSRNDGYVSFNLPDLNDDHKSEPSLTFYLYTIVEVANIVCIPTLSSDKKRANMSHRNIECRHRCSLVSSASQSNLLSNENDTF